MSCIAESACAVVGVDVVVAVLAGDVGDLAVSTSDGHQDVCGDPYICHPMCR